MSIYASEVEDDSSLTRPHSSKLCWARCSDMVNSMWHQVILDLELLTLDGLAWNGQALLELACCILRWTMKVLGNLKKKAKE